MTEIKVDDVLKKHLKNSYSTEELTQQYIDCVNNIYASIHKMKEIHDTVPSLESEIDSTISDVLHGVEIDDFRITAGKAYRVIHYLRRARMIRRRFKEIQSIHQSVQYHIGGLLNKLLAKEDIVRKGMKTSKKHNNITKSAVFEDLGIMNKQ